MMLLVVAGYELWNHHGTPLMPAIATQLAIGAGLLAALTRLIRNWALFGTLLALLGLAIAGVLTLQQTDNDGTTLATSLKLAAAGLFLLINLVALREIVWHGIGPILNRRDDRRAAQQAAEQG
jgi:hypothetical protein